MKRGIGGSDAVNEILRDDKRRIKELERHLDRRTDQLKVVRDELQALREAMKGLAHGEDWNNGTHAKTYRPKILALLEQSNE